MASWQSAYRGLLPDEYLAGLSVDRRAAVWERLLENPELDIFVADDAAGDVAGFASLAASRDADAPPGTGELPSIYVYPDHWRRGCGTVLLDTVLECARLRGYQRLTLWVLRSNDRARRFYEAAGFRPDGAEKTEQRNDDVVLHEVRYALEGLAGRERAGGADP